MSSAVALVTGASGGIGEAIAYRLAEEGEDLVLVARSPDRLAAVAGAAARRSGKAVHVVVADLARPGGCATLLAEVRAKGLTVRHLVNNAGYGLAGDVADLPADGQLGILDLNCRALTELTLAFLPDIVAARGGILNVASVAGFTPGPGLAVYYASKAYVVSFSRALAYELREQGVTVSALCPGPTPTGFGARAGFTGLETSPVLPTLDAATVARLGVAGYRRGRSLVVPGLGNKLLVALLAVLPSAAVLPILARIQRRRRAPDAPANGALP